MSDDSSLPNHSHIDRAVQTYNDPIENLFNLLQLLWQGKWLIIFITCLSTLASILICTYFLRPVFRASTTLAVHKYASHRVINFLNSSDFRRKLAEKEVLILNTAGEKKVLPGSLETSMVQLPFRFTTSETTRGQELFTLYWEGTDRENLVQMLTSAVEFTQRFLSVELDTEYQVKMKLIQKETGVLQQKLSEIKLDGGNIQTAPFDHLDIILRYTTYRSRLYELEDSLIRFQTNDGVIRKSEIIKSPAVPSKPAKPRKKLVVTLTFFFSLFFSVILVLGVNSYKKISNPAIKYT